MLSISPRRSSQVHLCGLRRLLWVRFAAFLTFVAVVSAWVAPWSMLAEDVRTGKLGGVCSLTAPVSGISSVGNAGNSDAPAGSQHCDVCASSGLALPQSALLVITSFAGYQVAAFTSPVALAASIPGLRCTGRATRVVKSSLTGLKCPSRAKNCQTSKTRLLNWS
ncbi:MAG: hypothetical protein H7228_13165 [Polaromonas sp.]|nr:hypothetical protein [Polaromonas sp.]